MAARLRMPVLAIATLSICLNLAIVGTAGRTLHVFNAQHKTNDFFLPLWPNHFDTWELHTLIGTSAAVVVLNAGYVVALSTASLPVNLVVLATSFLSTIVSLIAIILPAIATNHAPARDTLQTWTCMWRGVSDQGVPEQFNTLCHESRFAFYTTIPSFIIQLILLGAAVYAISTTSASPKRLRLDEEKGQELGDVRQASADSRTDSPRSTQKSERSLFGERHHG